jgi:hypothetical protein
MGLRDFRVIPNGVNGLEERLHIGWDSLVGSGARLPACMQCMQGHLACLHLHGGDWDSLMCWSACCCPHAC